jgi:hypothetical protein
LVWGYDDRRVASFLATFETMQAYDTWINSRDGRHDRYDAAVAEWSRQLDQLVKAAAAERVAAEAARPADPPAPVEPKVVLPDPPATIPMPPKPDQPEKLAEPPMPAKPAFVHPVIEDEPAADGLASKLYFSAHSRWERKRDAALAQARSEHEMRLADWRVGHSRTVQSVREENARLVRQWRAECDRIERENAQENRDQSTAWRQERDRVKAEARRVHEAALKAWKAECAALDNAVAARIAAANERVETFRTENPKPVPEAEIAEPDLVHCARIKKGFPTPTAVDRENLSELMSRAGDAGVGMHALLFGPPGTGKTTAGVRSRITRADGSVQPVYSVTLTTEQTAASLWGHWIPAGEDFVWHDGVFLRAWQEGAVLVINEINNASDDVSNLLHVLLDNPEVAQVTLPTGATARPKEGFRCIATINGDPDLAPAVMDRFAITAPVLVPSRQMIEKLPAHLRPLGHYVYSESNEDKTPEGHPTLSFRTLDKFADNCERLPETIAATIGTKGNLQAAQSLLEASVGGRLRHEQDAAENAGTGIGE